MAIAKIKKAEIIGLEKDRDRLLALLQKLECLELIDLSAGPAKKKESASLGPRNITEGPVNLLEMEEAIAYLGTLKEDAGIFSSMIKIKPQVYQQELNEVLGSFDYQGLLQELSASRSHLKHHQQHKEKLLEERHLLSPWKQLKIPLEELHDTARCGIILGMLRQADYSVLLKNCSQDNLEIFSEVVNQDKTNVYLAIIFMQEDFQRLEGALKNYHFNFVTLGRHRGTVGDRILEINRETLVLDDQLQNIHRRIIELSRQEFKLMAVYDYLANIRKRQEVGKELTRQEFTFFLSGWVKERDVRTMQQKITKQFQDLAIFISMPQEDEEVPVDLENPRILEPFEFITKIYGFPKYGEIDPTPYLAPFFFLYFGFCVSDVGYGVILSLLSWLILKKFRMGPQGQRFFRLFLFCGISTMIMGALTGSWFGNLFDLLADSNRAFLPLKNFKDSLIVLDPMKESTKLLGVALALGIVQVWFGNIIAAIGNLKNRRYLDIFLDQLPMLVFLFGLTGLGLIFLKLLVSAQLNLFKSSALLGALVLILTQGRAEKGWGAKLFYGCYNLYSALSGYLSDILSYSRLWALGLVTGVMASTINLISIQFSQIFTGVIPFIAGVAILKAVLSGVILITIFILGHSVSFLMNLLGAFVHPVRLQFVEFFSKFFKSGGQGFRPFRLESKYVKLQ